MKYGEGIVQALGTALTVKSPKWECGWWVQNSKDPGVASKDGVRGEPWGMRAELTGSQTEQTLADPTEVMGIYSDHMGSRWKVLSSHCCEKKSPEASHISIHLANRGPECFCSRLSLQGCLLSKSLATYGCRPLEQWDTILTACYKRYGQVP